MQNISFHLMVFSKSISGTRQAKGKLIPLQMSIMSARGQNLYFFRSRAQL